MNPARISASNGVYVLDGTGAYTNQKLVGFKPMEATVLAVCTGINVDTNIVVNFITKYNWDGTLNSTDLPYMVAENEHITDVTLTSGSIQGF